jgi:DNA-binding response OmpR family regulator
MRTISEEAGTDGTQRLRQASIRDVFPVLSEGRMHLAPMEKVVLNTLLSHENEIVRTEDILDVLDDISDVGHTAQIANLYVHKLRRKLADEYEITTYHKRGYLIKRKSWKCALI